MKLVKKNFLPIFIKDNLSQNYNEEISEDAIKVGKYIEEEINQIKLKMHLLQSVEQKSDKSDIFAGILPKNLLIANKNRITNKHLRKRIIDLEEKENKPPTNVIQSPSNHINTLKKFYHNEIELIKKLNYYNPDLMYNENEIIHLTETKNEMLDAEILNNRIRTDSSKGKIGLKRNTINANCNISNNINASKDSNKNIYMLNSNKNLNTLNSTNNLKDKYNSISSNVISNNNSIIKLNYLKNDLSQNESNKKINLISNSKLVITKDISKNSNKRFSHFPSIKNSTTFLNLENTTSTTNPSSLFSPAKNDSKSRFTINNNISNNYNNPLINNINTVHNKLITINTKKDFNIQNNNINADIYTPPSKFKFKNLRLRNSEINSTYVNTEADTCLNEESLQYNNNNLNSLSHSTKNKHNQILSFPNSQHFEEKVNNKANKAKIFNNQKVIEIQKENNYSHLSKLISSTQEYNSFHKKNKKSYESYSKMNKLDETKEGNKFMDLKNSTNNVYMKIVDYIINDESKNNHEYFSKERLNIDKEYLPAEAKIFYLKKLENLNKEKEKEKILAHLQKEYSTETAKNQAIITKLRNLHNKQEEINNEIDIVKIALTQLTKSVSEIDNEKDYNRLNIKIDQLDNVNELLKLMHRANNKEEEIDLVLNAKRKETKKDIGNDSYSNLLNKDYENLSLKKLPHKSSMFEPKLSSAQHVHIDVNFRKQTNQSSHIKKKSKNAQMHEINLLKQNFINTLDKNSKEMLNTYKKEIIIINFLKESLWQDNIQCETKIEIIDRDIKLCIEELTLHYHKQLIDGKDTRDKGLTWIIQSIWSLGSEVLISYLPKYLDESLISYLFLYSHKSIELKKVKDLLTEIKNRVRHYNGIKVRNQFKKLIFDRNDVRELIIKYLIFNI